MVLSDKYGQLAEFPFAADGVFTGEWDDVSQYSLITIHMTTDQPSAFLGLSMQTSIDGIVASFNKRVSVRPDSLKSVHTLVVTAKYFRVAYTNGDSIANVKIQVIYHKHKAKGLTTTTSQVISDESDVQLVRLANSINVDLARGLFRDKVSIHKFGHINIPVSGVTETVWGGGGLYVYPTVAQPLTVTSSSTDDDAGGLGAIEIKLFGLDADWNIIDEVVLTNGTSPSIATTQSFIRLTRAYNISVGTDGGSNIGLIEIRNADLLVLGDLLPDTGQTQSSMFSVPLGHQALITRMETTLDAKSAKTADLQLVKFDGHQTGRPKRLMWRLDGYEGRHWTSFNSYLVVGEFTDIEFRCNASANGSAISVNYDLVLHDVRYVDHDLPGIA